MPVRKNAFCAAMFGAVLMLLFAQEAASGPSEEEVRRLMEQLRVEARGAEEKRVNGLHGSFLNSAANEDRRLVSLALGSHYLQSNYRLALQYFSSAELASQEGDPLLPIVRYYMAEAHFKGGAFKRAAEIADSLLQVDLGDAWAKRVRALLIESLHAEGDNERMVAAFHEFSRRSAFSRRQEGLAKLAVESFERQRDSKNAIDVLEDLARGYPTTENSRWAFRKLSDYACDARSSRARYAFSRRLLISISRNSSLDPGLRDFVLAMADQPLQMESGAIRTLTPAERADFLFRAKLYPEALTATMALYDTERAKPESRLLPKIVFEIGRIHLRLHDPVLAARWFSKFVVDHPKHALVPRVHEMLGDSFRYLGLPLLAAERYGDAIAVRGTAYLKWQRFWSTYRGGDLKGALKLVGTSGAVVPRDGDDPQTVRYWQARILERLGRADEAKSAFRDVLAHGGDSYYANLVASRSPDIVDGMPKVAGTPAPTGSEERGDGLAARILGDSELEAEASSELKVVDSLLRVGMKDVASLLLSGLKWNQYTQLENFAAASRLALVLNDYQPSRRIRYSGYSPLKVLPEDFKKFVDHQIENSDDWKIYYPLAYDDFLKPVTDRLALDKYFVLSIMRTESYYNRDARSPVGASGLMQIMPYTALKIARLLNDQTFDVLDLPDPQTNVTYGAYYLDRLLRQYNGNFYVAAAAYNGGPTAVNQWLDACPDCASDEFVESIAFRETRRYVRKVMSSYAQYARIYGGKRSLPELPRLPAHLPEGEEMF